MMIVMLVIVLVSDISNCNTFVQYLHEAVTV
mgnify:CR=1 FL=1